MKNCAYCGLDKPRRFMFYDRRSSWGVGGITGWVCGDDTLCGVPHKKGYIFRNCKWEEE